MIARLQESARTLCPKIIKPADAEASRTVRAHVTNQLIKLSQAQNHFERVQYATILLNAICTAIIKFEAGEVCYLGRVQKKLRQHDPACAAAMQAAYLTICLDNGTGDFIEIASRLLDRLGGAVCQLTPEPLDKPAGPGA